MLRLSPVPFTAPSDLTLFQQLRASTRDLHDRVEAQIGLPGSFHSRLSYVACLRQFYSLYRPMYAGLVALRQGPWIGVVPKRRNFADMLAADLEALDSDEPLRAEAPLAARPELPRFAYGLGAFYVLEGATLGGTVNLRKARIEGAEDASSFFGAVDVAFWQNIRSAIDKFGRARPDEIDGVISGARRTFASVGDWMEQGRWCTQ